MIFRSYAASFVVALVVAAESFYLFRADMLASNIEARTAMIMALRDSAWLLAPPVALLLVRDVRATTLVTCLYLLVAVWIAQHVYLIASGSPPRDVYPTTGAFIQLGLLVASFASIAAFFLTKLVRKLNFLLRGSRNGE